MKTIIKNFTIAAILFTLSCEKFVEVDVPTNRLVTKTVFESDATATAALFNIYSTMITQAANPYTISLYPGLSADELTPYSSILGLRQLYTNSIFPLDGYSKDIWNGAYNCIFKANAVIEGCLASTTLSTNVRKQLIAESKFVRAFWHFYLVNYFGPVPIVVSTDYKINSSLPRAPTETVYTQIEQDLQESKIDLNENYVNANSVSATTERVRPNRAAAAALLARVYLYRGNYVDAEKESSGVIAQSTTYSLVPLDQVFLKNSLEAIWQIMKPTPTTNNTPEGSGYILTNKPAPSSPAASNSVSMSLLNSFDATDLRRSKWVGRYIDKTVTPNVEYFFPYKYKVQNGSNVTEYSMILRLSEQFLIRAEARVYNHNIPGAIADLDEVRKRAGLSLIAITRPTISENDLIDEILRERRRELFCEWGHRWFDIRRMGRIDVIMGAEAMLKGSSWKSSASLYPIPTTELQNNLNLKQNDGYN